MIPWDMPYVIWSKKTRITEPPEGADWMLLRSVVSKYWCRKGSLFLRIKRK